LSDALIWLGYGVSAALAFAAVHFRRWRIVPAMLASAAAGLAIAVLGVLTTSEEDRSPWETVEITLNGSMCLMFAALGAAVALAIRHARSPKP
jgi:threonine dehydrogenase-like Zn-dependent dehydrogenase